MHAYHRGWITDMSVVGLAKDSMRTPVHNGWRGTTSWQANSTQSAIHELAMTLEVVILAHVVLDDEHREPFCHEDGMITAGLSEESCRKEVHIGEP
eukprot:2655807-Prymnesium_polylepis.1